MQRKLVRIAAAALLAVMMSVGAPAVASMGSGKVTTQDFHF
nr:hypothetical protein GCM10020063_019110 [Dactylosporangium thailandense]